MVLNNRKCQRELFTKSKDGVLLHVDVMTAKLKNVINFTVLPHDKTSSIKPVPKPVNERDNLLEEQKSKRKGTIFEQTGKSNESKEKRYFAKVIRGASLND